MKSRIIEVAKVIAERDGYELSEAIDLVSEARDDVLALIEDGRGFEGEDVWMDLTGLELDYLMDVL